MIIKQEDDEIYDLKFLEFAIKDFSEMMGYIVQGDLNVRIHRDITGLPDGSFGR